MLRLENASVRFGIKGESVEALSDVSLTINKGEWVSIVGPSGSGKTTLLNVMAGKQDLTEGSVYIDNVNLKELNEQDKQRLRRETMGFIYQHYRLFDQYSVLENIMLPQYPYCSRKKLQKKAEMLSLQVGIGHRLNHLPDQLSGGEKQRTAIARALLNKPKLLLCDEPTGNLDAENRERILEMLGALNEKGMTLVVVTHDAEVAGKSDRQLLMHDGVLEEQVLT